MIKNICGGLGFLLMMLGMAGADSNSLVSVIVMLSAGITLFVIYIKLERSTYHGSRVIDNEPSRNRRVG